MVVTKRVDTLEEDGDDFTIEVRAADDEFTYEVRPKESTSKYNNAKPDIFTDDEGTDGDFSDSFDESDGDSELQEKNLSNQSPVKDTDWDKFFKENQELIRKEIEYNRKQDREKDNGNDHGRDERSSHSRSKSRSKSESKNQNLKVLNQKANQLTGKNG